MPFVMDLVGVYAATDRVPTLGILSCLDGYMNIALEQTEEHVNGRVTNRYGDAFIRGNNGVFCTTSIRGDKLTEVARKYSISLLQKPCNISSVSHPSSLLLSVRPDRFKKCSLECSQ